MRTFDDPATWTEPGVRHLATNGIGGEAYRTDPLDDQWELYDLTADPIEADNRWTDPDLHDLRPAPADAAQAGAGVVGARAQQPWPYADRQPPTGKSPGVVRQVLGRLRRSSQPREVTSGYLGDMPDTITVLPGDRPISSMEQ